MMLSIDSQGSFENLLSLTSNEVKYTLKILFHSNNQMFDNYQKT